LYTKGGARFNTAQAGVINRLGAALGADGQREPNGWRVAGRGGFYSAGKELVGTVELRPQHLG